MNIKNFIKKKLEKDNTQYLVIIKKEHTLALTEKLSLTSLTKYLKTNEKKIIMINIKIMSN